MSKKMLHKNESCVRCKAPKLKFTTVELSCNHIVSICGSCQETISLKRISLIEIPNLTCSICDDYEERTIQSTIRSSNILRILNESINESKNLKIKLEISENKQTELLEAHSEIERLKNSDTQYSQCSQCSSTFLLYELFICENPLCNQLIYSSNISYQEILKSANCSTCIQPHIKEHITCVKIAPQTAISVISNNVAFEMHEKGQEVKATWSNETRMSYSAIKFSTTFSDIQTIYNNLRKSANETELELRIAMLKQAFEFTRLTIETGQLVHLNTDKACDILSHY